MSIEQTGATTDIETTVSSMWAALSARDWDGVKRQLAPHCIYLDMPVGPAAVHYRHFYKVQIISNL